MSDKTTITLAELVASASDVMGNVREELRTQLHNYLDGLSTMQNNGIPRRGLSFDDPIQCRFDHRVLDELVQAIAPAVVRRVLSEEVELASEAPVVAVPLASVIQADPILRELLDTTGSARAALGSVARGMENGDPWRTIPLSLVAWSRMVDAHRKREGKPALQRIETKHPPSTFLTPAQYAIDRDAQRETASDRARLEGELAELETALDAAPVVAMVRREYEATRDERAQAIVLRTRQSLRDRVRASLGRIGWTPRADQLDAIIAAVTDAPCADERCARCHQTAPNPQGCALCNPAELGERLKRALATTATEVPQ